MDSGTIEWFRIQLLTVVLAWDGKPFTKILNYAIIGIFAGTGRKTISQTSSTTTYERVVPGWDVELGYRLPDYPQLAFAVRAFRWDFVSRTDNSGIEGSVNWRGIS